MKLNVTLVSTSDSGGGAEAIARLLHEQYLKAAIDSTLVVGTIRSPNVQRTKTLDNEASRRWATRRLLSVAESVTKYKGKVRGAAGLGRLIRWAAEPIRDTRIRIGHEDFVFPGIRELRDGSSPSTRVLHLHNLHGGYFDLRALPGLSAERRTFLTLHDQWMLTGHCAYSFECSRWMSGCGECPDLDIYPAIRRDATEANLKRKQKIYDRSRLHISTPSRWLLDQIPHSVLGGLASEPRHIPYGIDQTVFAPGDRLEARRRLGLSPSHPIVSFVANLGRSNPFKDWATIEDALEIVGQDARNVVALAIGQGGPEQTLGSVTIKAIPRVDDPREMKLWYQASDLFVHAAKADNFPLTVLEAQSCGLPVVATAVGGVPEQIQHMGGVTGGLQGGSRSETASGVLVATGDAHGMAKAISMMLDNQSLRETLGKNAHRLAARRYSLQRYVKDTLNWYTDIVDQESDSPGGADGKLGPGHP